MDIKQLILSNLSQSDFVVSSYLADLSPDELLERPVPGANHIAWQLGHLISSERHLVNQAVPDRMPPLPAGFAERHTKQTAGGDDPAAFLSKQEYLAVAGQVRAAALSLLEGLQPSDFDRPVTKVPPFAKTVGDTFLLVGNHWLMHAGQWAVVRRKRGRAPLF